MYIYGIYNICRKDRSMDILISNADARPIYEQIASQIKSLIMTGALQAGDALPSMRLLAKELRISVITTKRAYEELEQEGFLETVTGKGSFVAARNTALIRESQLHLAQEHLEKAVSVAKSGGISLPELTEILKLLYEGE